MLEGPAGLTLFGGSDGYQAVFSLGEIDPAFGNQSVLVAYADTVGQLGPNAPDGLARIVVPAYPFSSKRRTAVSRMSWRVSAVMGGP